MKVTWEKTLSTSFPLTVILQLLTSNIENPIPLFKEVPVNSLMRENDYAISVNIIKIYHIIGAMRKVYTRSISD